MEYCRHVLSGAFSCLLELPDKLQKRIWRNVEMWAAEVFSIGITLVDVLRNCLNWFHFLFLEGGLLVFLIDCMIFLSPFLNVTRMSTSTVRFLVQLDPGLLCLWNAYL